MFISLTEAETLSMIFNPKEISVALPYPKNQMLIFQRFRDILDTVHTRYVASTLYYVP